MDEKNTVKFLELVPKVWNLVPGNFGEDCPSNGIHYDEDGRLIDFFCDSCPFWEQCERDDCTEKTCAIQHTFFDRYFLIGRLNISFLTTLPC